MWQYQNTDELYHHGVLGMKWGIRKARQSINTSKSNHKKSSKKSKQNNLKVSKGSSAAIDKYFDETKKNTKIRHIGYGAKLASYVLMDSAKKSYNKHKNNATMGQYHSIQGKAITSKVLSNIGDVAITGSMIKQYRDFRKYY